MGIYSGSQLCVTGGEKMRVRMDEWNSVHVTWGSLPEGSRASITISGSVKELQKLFLDAYKAVVEVSDSDNEIDRDEDFVS